MDKDQIYLAEIKEFCQKIIKFTDGVDYNNFVANEQLFLSVIKLIENIGEASKRLSDEVRVNYPKVEWQKAMAMRNRLVHHYMDVDLEIIYDVATSEVPALLKSLNS